MTAKERTDNKTFQFIIYPLWTGLGGNYFLWAIAS